MANLCAIALSLVVGPTLVNAYHKIEYEPIAGYRPVTKVTDHNAIDLDLDSMRVELGYTKATNFIEAQAIYEQGAFSGSYAEVTLTDASGLPIQINKGTFVAGKNEAGDTVLGDMMEDAPVGTTKLKILYRTSNVQSEQVGCRVGGMLSVDFQKTEDCFVQEGTLDFYNKGRKYEYRYNVLKDNKNARTIQKFSSNAEDEMLLCENCPHRTYEKFFNYYEVPDYGDRWVTAALESSETRFVRGNADFSAYRGDGRAVAVEKGAAALNIWMYVIRKMEEALDLCAIDDHNSIHSWDQAVAYYSGSMQGPHGNETGILIHALTDWRCAEFKTCGEVGNTVEGRAKLNHDIFHEFELGKAHVLNNTDCDAARKNKERIENLMAVPLVQSILKYAYVRDRQTDSEIFQANGATMAAAVVPLVHHCNPVDAATIHLSMMVGSDEPHFSYVKSKLEKNYQCMGITCADVGGFYDSQSNEYYRDAAPCDENAGPPTLEIVLCIVFGLVLPGILVAALWYVRHRRSKGRSMHQDQNSLIYPNMRIIYPPQDVVFPPKRPIREKQPSNRDLSPALIMT